ncbi:hypothetical protein [Caenimonas sp. SL110]|uniref:hypothetical protein n=1 Tax=Caenimonas sp. SL110 TaxID=1450524 RepID=UPI00065395DF|nr:hypothetical protein [Caenimonas sp. SL110]
MSTAAVSRLLRLLLLAAIATIVFGGIAGGLLRVGIALPVDLGADWPLHAAQAHAALMIGGFLGTVIGIERAVALKHRAAFIAPVSSALGGLMLLVGRPGLGASLLVAAAICFIAINIEIVRRQSQPHTWLLLASAVAWFIGNLMFAFGLDGRSVMPWWFAFLIWTIAAERLEMTRLMRRRPAAGWLLLAIVVLMVLGSATSALQSGVGGIAYGIALVCLGAWLFVFDIARRTVLADGLTRYMAVCLLGGYAWLVVAGMAWVATAIGFAARDVALHALGLGFVVSMIMGHAPVILPAVARVKLQFGVWFYLPLAVLHLSLALRLGPGFADLVPRANGALLNAFAIAFFAATVVGSALAWRYTHRAPIAQRKLP